jgi:A/G-specific adenine glycosylase
VLVSEVMLQQTQAARVVPAFRRFLRSFPSLASLANASRADVVRAWSGLGYNRRAVALQEAARLIARENRGRIPKDPETLIGFPGVGPYTAAAVACHAYGRPVAPVDTNVRRVVARAALGLEPHEAEPVEVQRAATAWVDVHDPSAWSQALMDLGSEICRPVPRCGECPIRAGCRFYRAGRTPTRAPTRQAPFAGSTRQLRGRIVSELRRRDLMSLQGLARATAEPVERVAEVVRGLARDRLVSAGPAALAGRPIGRVSLA